MNKPNWVNRTIWTGDNLDIMRGMNSESVDLIYCDPPFNSNRTYSAPIGSQAAGAAFKDTWSLSDIDEAWHGEVAEAEPALYAVIDAASIAHGKGMKSYLIMMAARLLEMRRLLKPTGSFYLHCDPTASHYLKLTCDAVFRQTNYRNEIVWKRTSSRSDAKGFGRIHDVILLYNKSKTFIWNRVYQDHDPEYVKRFYRHDDGDGRGRWRSADLTASGPRNGESGEPWRDFDPNMRGNHWRTPTQGGMADYIREHNIIDRWPDAYPSVHQRLDALDAAGLIHWPEKEGGMPALKRYLSSTQGNTACDMITDINPLAASSKEKVGYPTQKPLALLDRIICASSNPGDMVLDPFCGCATACIAAEIRGREWAGIDLSEKAAELVLMRADRELGADIAQGSTLFRLTHRQDIPKRTDQGKLPSYRTHKHVLFGRQEGRCNGCQFAFPFVNYHVDHVIPRAKGGTDHLDNLQLLCGACNSLKGDRPHEWLIAELGRQNRRK